MQKIKIWNKEGVIGDLHPELQRELGKVINYYEDKGLLNFYITSKREGEHKAGSFHPIGRAVDFEAQGIKYDQLRVMTGLDFDLIIFNDGKNFHLEYDPKGYKS